ncbi:hypothetical protein [Oleidesulfovibrio sp.]|uniref:hypothetical protein n=1 Tax=Oleidesulfovibrio sp. TaxID=2909707 RepID=UPI003A8B65F9
MSLESSLPVLLVQMGHVQKITHNEQSHPETQQAAAQQNVAETLKRGQSQVEKTQQSEKSKLEADADGRGGGAGTQQQRAGSESEPDEHTGEQEQKKGPWTGNIVNVKV